MADQTVTQTTSADRIGEVAFDLCSISVILRHALDKLADSSAYGRTDTEDGAMMADVGQVLIDAQKRLAGFSNELHSIKGKLANH